MWVSSSVVFQLQTLSRKPLLPQKPTNLVLEVIFTNNNPLIGISNVKKIQKNHIITSDLLQIRCSNNEIKNQINLSCFKEK